MERERPPVSSKQIWTIVAIAVPCLMLWLFTRDCASAPQAKTSSQIPLLGYNSERICEDAFDKEQNYRKSDIRSIHITLHEGCWSEFIYLPDYWTRNTDGFNAQSEGDQNGFWVAFWFSQANHPQGPFGPNYTHFWQNYGSVMRLQGHGQIVLFTHKAYTNE